MSDTTGQEAAEVLAALVKEAAGSDPVAVRSARLAQLSREQRVWLSDVTEALDLLLEALDERAGAIARGEVQPPAPAVAPEPEVPASEAPTRVEEPAVTAADLAAADATAAEDTTGERPVVTPEQVAAAEAPTIVTPAVTDADLAAAAPPPQVELEPALDEAPEPELALEPEPEEVEPAQPPPSPREVLAERWDDEEPGEEVTPGWTRTAELLFEDALRLFRLGDTDGALISLERLLAVTELNEDLREFVRVNEERLLQIYEGVFGSWDRVLTPIQPDASMPRTFLEVDKVARVLARINGSTTLGDLLDTPGLSRLESIATVSQLIRAKAVSVRGGHG